MYELPIKGFKGQWGFMSNYWESPVWLEGLNFATVEHAYQAAKTFNYQDRLLIQQCETPGKAKRAGQKVQMRNDWDTVKPLIMMGLLTQKFMISELQERLLSSGTAYLEETNDWNDIYWGVCNGVGLNILGKQLMSIRGWLRCPQQPSAWEMNKGVM